MPDQEADLDEYEDDAADVVRGLDAPVRQHGAGREAELLEREVAARLRQLLARDVPAHPAPPLAVLQRCQHEQIGPLVIASVDRTNALNDLVSQLQLEHVSKVEASQPVSKREALRIPSTIVTTCTYPDPLALRYTPTGCG